MFILLIFILDKNMLYQVRNQSTDVISDMRKYNINRWFMRKISWHNFQVIYARGGKRQCISMSFSLFKGIALHDEKFAN